MRRMIRNTTAIAACLSLLAPQLAQAQLTRLDPGLAGPGQADSPAAPVILAQAEVPPVPSAEEAEATEADAVPAEEPAAEPVAEEPVAEEPVAEEPAPADAPVTEDSLPEAEPAPEPAPVEEAEPAPDPAPEAQTSEADPATDAVPEPVEAAAEPEAAEEIPAEAPAEALAEEADAASPDAGVPDVAASEAAPVDAPADPAMDDDRPAEAAREQQTDRPAEAARAQDSEPPAPRDEATSTEADPLAEALEAEAAPDAAAEAPTGAAEAAPEASSEAASETAVSDEDALRDALAEEGQADPGAPAGEEPAADTAGAEAAPGDTPADDAAAQPAEADAPVTEASRQAAEETAAPAAAALDEATQGEVVEQEITEQNSRSSAEDFATSLRDALQPQAEAQAEPEAAPRAGDGDDGNNDLARALLLGLGAVAVGTYLNNNRQVALSAPDRVVVTLPDGSQQLIKDDTALLRQPGSTVSTENFDDGSSRTIVTRPDGSRVVTIRDADLRVLRRTLVSADGTQTRLIDDTAAVEPVDVSRLPAPAPAYGSGLYQDEQGLREALQREVGVDRAFTLSQVRNIAEVRALVPPIAIDSITFDTGSAAINPDQARQLSALGGAIRDAIARNPREMFLIEGHTDTVGSDAANLALSDRRAESVALALTEYFRVPPENMVVQGYGESFLLVRQEGDVRENRRAAVRRITELLQTAAAR